MMTIRLTDDKKDKISKSCKMLTQEKAFSIREVAKVIGLIVSSFPAVRYGPMHYRQLETEKSNAVTLNKGDYDVQMTLSMAAKTELYWWINKYPNCFQCNKPRASLCDYPYRCIQNWLGRGDP